ncbi:hypothetical protein GGX14DRAFT_565800 [Mycena pura]|uniref:Cytochrome b561 domain-containing protein n=1 Tax=Mycena pura TaxID=153505 RepID=A0AAD6VKU6_9AGAR|nr:hypothetical protein GGX14DRAFT_565800 [Mycena pura]
MSPKSPKHYLAGSGPGAEEVRPERKVYFVLRILLRFDGIEQISDKADYHKTATACLYVCGHCIPPFSRVRVHRYHMTQSSPLLVAREGASPPYQVPIIVHAFSCVLAFALFLPGGAILARYMRTFRPWWYTGHWVAQFAFAGPLIVIGVSMGFLADHQLGKTPMDNHKARLARNCSSSCSTSSNASSEPWPTSSNPRTESGARYKNYIHGILGVLLLVLGMYQIHTGYDQEWPMYMGYGRLPNYVDILWIIWCIVVIVTYGAGMWLLRKQFRQEAARNLLATNIVLGALEAQPQPDANSITNSTNTNTTIAKR